MERRRAAAIAAAEKAYQEDLLAKQAEAEAAEALLKGSDTETVCALVFGLVAVTGFGLWLFCII